MKLLVQWATKRPQGWITLDSSEWDALPKKPEPIGGEVVDDEPGWLSNVCVQGMGAGSADHVAVEHLGDSVRVTSWNDDPDDYEPGQFFARVLTFHPLKPDPVLGGAINTDIESVMYAGADRFKELEAVDFADTEVKPWSEFIPPPESITRHGIWLTDELANAHRPMAVPPSWREWGKNGDVPCQRDLGRWLKAKGTVTYYQRGTDNSGPHPDNYIGSPFDPAVGQNFRLYGSSTTANEITRDILQLTDSEVSFAWTTELGEPNDADWPTGDYRAQIDITELEGGDVRAEIQILQITSTGAIRKTFGTSGLYGTPGLKLFSLINYNPPSGATSDRYQIRVLGTNLYEHQARYLKLDVRSTDSFADGPWTAAVIEGAATATGVGTASAAGVQVLPQSASATGIGTAVAAAVLILIGAATSTGVGTAAGAATLVIPGTATATGIGTASAAGTVVGMSYGTATATGVGTAAGAATVTIPGAAVATGVGTASAAGVQVLPRSASATGVGTAAGAATLAIPGTATATGVGTASATGTVVGVSYGTAVATGVGTASGAAVQVLPRSAVATGVGTASAAGVQVLPQSASATGVGTASAAAMMILAGTGTATGVGTASAAGIVSGMIAYWGEPCETYTGGPRRAGR